MEKQQFEQLVKLLKELNEYLEHISSCLSKIDNSLDIIKDNTEPKAHFRI
ncbi:hypothetical protein ES706_03259 [subsurface metagenome]